MHSDPTPAEAKFWSVLRNRQLAGLKFRRQTPRSPFIADFYCAEVKVMVELDGDSHNERETYDERRTRIFERDGCRVIRFINDDVPKLEDKLAFKVTSAVPGDEGAVAFVDKNSAVGRSLAEVYEWRTMYFPVVELQWVPAGKDGRYVRLNRIVRPTWRRIGE